MEEGGREVIQKASGPQSSSLWRGQWCRRVLKSKTGVKNTD